MSRKFTVFTPCYNGEKTIEKVFKSVESQTYTNFEWIIINDGSTDNSKKVIENLIEMSPIRDNIIFINQENKGKHISWNRGVDLATGEYWLSADADDSFVPETLEYFNNKIETVISNKLIPEDVFSGVNVCVVDPETNTIVGDKYPFDGLVSDNIQIHYKYHIKGEHWGIVKTNLLKKYKFPEINGKFYSENRIWYNLALDKYKVICYNDALRFYYYEKTSLTHNVSYRLNKDILKMRILSNIWIIRNCFWKILRYSKIDLIWHFLRLSKDLFLLLFSYVKCV